jgi:hypothetical protein
MEWIGEFRNPRILPQKRALCLPVGALHVTALMHLSADVTA